MIILKIIDKILNIIFITFFLTIITISLYALYDINTVYDNAKLSGDVLKYKPDIKKPEMQEFDLEALQENVNEDIIGWIQIDGTNIDYPILYSTTSLEYLSKGYDGKYNPAGSIFIDVDNSKLFEDDYTVIYGHNVADKLMFSDIKHFKDPEFFSKNKGGKLYTKDKVYDIKIYTSNVIESSKSIAYLVDNYKNGKNSQLINTFEESAINKNDIEISPNDKFVLLSTCNGAATTERAVLFAKIEETKDTGKVSNVDRDRNVQLSKKEEQNLNNKIKEYKYNNEVKKEKNSTKKYSKLDMYLTDIRIKVVRIVYDPIKLTCALLAIMTFIADIIVIKRILKIKK